MEYGLIGGRLGHSYSKAHPRGAGGLRLPPVPAAYAGGGPRVHARAGF